MIISLLCTSEQLLFSPFQANSNSSNMKLLAAILVGALFPNVVQVMTPENKYTQSGGGAIPKAPRPEELRFKTKIDGYVSTFVVYDKY